MRFFATVSATAALVGSALAQSALLINTPTALYSCQPYQLTWSGGQAPYYVRVLPGGSLTGTPIETLLSATSETSYTWNVNLASGTYITLTVSDSAGVTAGSAPVTVALGDTGCLSSSASSAASTQSSASSASSAVSSTASSASSSASSVSSSVSSAASSVASSASSVISSATSTTATGSTGSPSASATGGGNGAGSLKAGSALALVAGVVAALA
ncbi:hypothetical protein JCM10207_001689 [Rhodosporidiobolus poonsookiae]